MYSKVLSEVEFSCSPTLMSTRFPYAEGWLSFFLTLPVSITEEMLTEMSATIYTLSSKRPASLQLSSSKYSPSGTRKRGDTASKRSKSLQRMSRRTQSIFRNMTVVPNPNTNSISNPSRPKGKRTSYRMSSSVMELKVQKPPILLPRSHSHCTSSTLADSPKIRGKQRRSNTTFWKEDAEIKVPKQLDMEDERTQLLDVPKKDQPKTTKISLDDFLSSLNSSDEQLLRPEFKTSLLSHTTDLNLNPVQDKRNRENRSKSAPNLSLLLPNSDDCMKEGHFDFSEELEQSNSLSPSSMELYTDEEEDEEDSDSNTELTTKWSKQITPRSSSSKNGSRREISKRGFSFLSLHVLSPIPSYGGSKHKKQVWVWGSNESFQLGLGFNRRDMVCQTKCVHVSDSAFLGLIVSFYCLLNFFF